tara:strand:+ start:386 stop:613 length:228 start_codon:yes stop_codon:yes gene_type:complete
MELNGSTVPLFPSIQCGQAPWNRSAFSRKLRAICRWLIPASLMMMSFSIPVKTLRKPNPDPPVVTVFESNERSFS